MNPSVPPPLPTTATQCRWFYANSNEPVGPLSFDELESLVRAGKIEPQTLVLREGEEEWQPFASFSPVTPAEQVPGNITSVQSRFAVAKAHIDALSPGARIVLLCFGLFAGLVAMLFALGIVLAIFAPKVGDQGSASDIMSVTGANKIGKHVMSREDAAVALRDVEDLANDLESLLSQLQDGRPITVETLGKVNRWRSEMRSTRNMIETREIRPFSASMSLMVALNNMEQAWNAFERAVRARNGSDLNDASFAHTEELRMMRESIESAREFMAEGKY